LHEYCFQWRPTKKDVYARYGVPEKERNQKPTCDLANSLKNGAMIVFGQGQKSRNKEEKKHMK
jgi:hypothetical protein